MKYEGWTNYSTWSLALFIDNNEAAYNRTIRLLQGLGRKNYAPDFLKAEWGHRAAKDVNWRELAEHFINKTNELI